MSEHKITVNGGSSVRLLTAGKYCDRDIVVNALGGGVNLPELTNPGAAGDLMAGKELIDETGAKVTGSFTLDPEMTEQDSLIRQIKTALKGKAAGGAGGDSDLPNGYTRCDFIEFDGDQLVDTGIIGNQNTKIRASFTWGGSTQNHLFGCASSGNDKSITSYMNGSWRFGNKAASKTIQKNNNDLPYSVLLDKTTIGVTGSRTSISDVPDFETIGTLLLGGARNSNGELPGSGIVGRAFDFRIWDGETLVMEMIPVTDDTVYRFWDSVSKQFFDSITDVPLGGGNL